MCRIEHLQAREVFDSRGRPTLEVEMACRGSRSGWAIVPSGASTGRLEARELRDGRSNRLAGRGVLQAVENVRAEIAPALIGMDANDQQAVDSLLCRLDGTENKSRLGANALLGVSLAAAHAAAEAKGLSRLEHYHQLWTSLPVKRLVPRRRTGSLGHAPCLPLPMVNMISGGLHAGGHLAIQDFLILPIGAETFRQALEWTVTIYYRLGALLAERGYDSALVGDEGGYGPRLASHQQALEFVLQAIEAAQLAPGRDVALGLDVAASHFSSDRGYSLTEEKDQPLSSEELIDLFDQWVQNYPLLSLEDALSEDDWSGWRQLTERLGDRVQLLGDDLFVTNPHRLQRGIESVAANSILIKPNQIGTLWETLETIRLALDHDYWPVISARSGESEDATIADLAVATGAGQIKIGSVARSERLAKYNQLLRLEEGLQSDADFAGGRIFAALNSRIEKSVSTNE